MNFDFIKNLLNQLEQNDLLRKPFTIDSVSDTSIRIEKKVKILFCSNNYLNLAQDKRLIEAAKTAMENFGFGSAASRLISGSLEPHIELEKRLADLFQKESALVFPSGYMANLAVLQSIPQKGDLILLDKIDHASIIDAAKGSDAQFRTYHRTQFDKIEKFLASSDFNRKFIVTESVFSMDGDFADLKKLVELKKKYNAYLIVDEAHAFGCFGETGAGLAEELGILNEIDIVVATLSKSAGCSGGFVVSDKCVIDFLVNKARPFIYTTAPLPANSAAAVCALEIIKNANDKRKRLKENSDYLRAKLKALNFDTAESASQIVPVIIGDNKRTLEISKSLFDKGFFVVAIRPPTVAPGTSRLRISLQSEHTKEQIDSLCDCLKSFSTQGA
ncbi:MAG: 8-amino-7-oxononanoate synthase [Planctomycetes bacterium GWF2_41_51]|nr:MAG: 8-amino-7-oxononanoate synthase [Planctomycetes bacterium GWF2_41_51]HBG27599.1 8-amino-7-oxononanoate synthase [Phycisphaerales bacterium]